MEIELHNFGFLVITLHLINLLFYFHQLNAGATKNQMLTSHPSTTLLDAMFDTKGDISAAKDIKKSKNVPRKQQTSDRTLRSKRPISKSMVLRAIKASQLASSDLRRGEPAYRTAYGRPVFPSWKLMENEKTSLLLQERHEN
ncbi:hypothetical protein IF2G_10831 [Cordyceps javanica]|nr:hypothetical protein IF2G_10831 [Cordyceps javanica]